MMNKPLDMPDGPYAHRNGESDAPTEAGFFWFVGRKRKHPRRVRREGVYRIWWNSGELHIQIQPWSACLVDDLTGQWYGPIVPPWDAPQPAAGGPLPEDVLETITSALSEWYIYNHGRKPLVDSALAWLQRQRGERGDK